VGVLKGWPSFSGRRENSTIESRIQSSSSREFYVGNRSGPQTALRGFRDVRRVIASETFLQIVALLEQRHVAAAELIELGLLDRALDIQPPSVHVHGSVLDNDISQ
jgi:hypothetical protein